MGCDIHMWAEVRNDDGVWEKVGDVFPNKYGSVEQQQRQHDRWIAWCAEHPEYDDDDKGEDWGHHYRPLIDEPYHSRNYDLFAILADVRNGYGFAGVPTGQGFVPIASPRGVPDDASPEYRTEVERWDGDGHSHSWLTIAELKAYDWDRASQVCGVIPAAEFESLDGTGKAPKTWSGDISGPGINVYEASEYRKAKRDKTLAERPFVRYWWQESYQDCVGEFLTETLPRLEVLGKPDDVRIVFFFDN